MNFKAKFLNAHDHKLSKISTLQLFRWLQNGSWQGRSDGGYWLGGGGVVNSPTFLKLTYSEVWVGHSENKGDNRLDSTNEILLNCIVSTKFKKL